MIHVFLLCSGLAALVNLLVGYLLYGVMGLDSWPGYALSVSLAFLAGMMVSFLLNRRFTYAPSGREPQQEMSDFLAVSLVGMLLTTGMALLLNGAIQGVSLGALPRSEAIAHICAVAITAGYSFLAHKHISFRRKGTAWPPEFSRLNHSGHRDSEVGK